MSNFSYERKIEMKKQKGTLKRQSSMLALQRTMIHPSLPLIVPFLELSDISLSNERTPWDTLFDFIRAKKSQEESLPSSESKVKSEEKLALSIEKLSGAINNLAERFFEASDILRNISQKIDMLSVELNKKFDSISQEIINLNKLLSEASIFSDIKGFESVISLIDDESKDAILNKARANEFLLPILSRVINVLNELLNNLKNKDKLSRWNFIITYHPGDLDWERIIIWIEGDFSFSNDEEKDEFEDVIIEREIEKVIQSFKRDYPGKHEKIDEVNVLLSVFLKTRK
ncbi:MAG: hypothetical protein ACTSSP_11065 [Candidatus Asgardarchaeia archaeon]